MRVVKGSLVWMMLGILGSVATVVHFEWERKVYPGTGEYNRIEEYTSKRERRLAGYRKLNAPDQFLLLQRLARTGDGQLEPTYPMNYRYEEMVRAGILSRRSGNIYAAGLNKSGAALSWVERGPANVGGRTRGLIIDPDDATHNTWYAAAVGGGIWKTTNAGNTWTNLSPALSNLAATVLAMAPSNHDVIYLGTGEGYGNLGAIDGDGIWKSVNRGLTWSQLPSTVAQDQPTRSFQNVNRILVDPNDPDILVVATNKGIYRSTNGGASWGTSYSSSSLVQSLISNPQNFSTQYAGTNPGGVLKSTNGGVSWYNISGIVSGGRTELAISPIDTNRLFASVDGDFLYMSLNGGNEWSKVTTSPSDFLGGQGWYDNFVVCHPYDTNSVFTAGVDVLKFVIHLDSSSASVGVTDVDTVGTGGFLSVQLFATPLPYFGGGLGIGNDLGGATTTAVPSDYVSVQLRFGPGKSQKAHRFKPATQGSGVSAANYLYQNYVYVPFEVWDITNNRQLMFSFRDENNDGAFDLNLSTSNDGTCREYMFIHAVQYDSTSPNGAIAVNGGIKIKTIYEMTPRLTDGATWSSSLPTATMTITVGLVTSYKSTMQAVTDGYDQYPGGVSGPNFGGIQGAHVDNHNILLVPVASPNSFKMLLASDGGLAFSTNSGASFSSSQGTVRGYNTTQFYGVDKKPASNQYIGGAQDNGTYVSPSDASVSSSWSFSIGGDGFDAAWKYDNGNWLIGGSQYNGFQRSTDGGTVFVSSTNGLETGSSSAPFLSPIGKSNKEPDVIYAIGTSGVFQSTNFGGNWSLRPISTNWSMTSLTTVEVSEADPTIVWAGGAMLSSRRLHVSTDGGLTFSQVTNYSDGRGNIGNVSGIATHPIDRNTAYALFSVADRPKIVRTTDLGQTWQDISGFGVNDSSSTGFPDVAVYSMIHMPHNPSEIWVGTEIGLFISTNNGASWQYSNNGLPAVAIWQMRIVDKQVVVATHGRGVWTVDIPELPATVIAPKINGLSALNNSVNVALTIRQSCDSVIVYADSVVVLRELNTAPRDVSFDFATFETKKKRIQAVAFLNGFAHRSVEKSIDVAFDPDTTKPTMALSALASPVVNVLRFAVGASEPLIDANVSVNSNSLTMTKKGSLFFGSYTLSGPGNLLVQASGEDTSDNFGSVERTYQVTQLSKPTHVGPFDVLGRGSGYLVTALRRADSTPPAWLRLTDAIEIIAMGEDELSIEATYVLDPDFGSLEERKIGFYAWDGADWTYVGGEGRSGRVSSKAKSSLLAVFYNPDHEILPTEFDLEANYPNPFNPTTTIRYAVPTESRVILRVYNMLGQEVRTLVNQVRSPGRYEVTWDGRNQAGHAVSSGVYIYRLEGTNFVRSRKMLFVK